MSDVYSMTRAENKGAINVFLTDDVGGGGSIELARKLLAGIPHGAEKAIGSAIKRAASSGEAYAARAISQEYVINTGVFKKYTQSKRHFVTSGGETTVDIEFRGHHIPLITFDTSVGKNGRISARVKRASARQTLDSAFFATVGNHSGIFEREGDSRFPIEQKFGPSAPQMMSANEDVAQEIGDKIREVFDERLDHEIMRVLNGWGL